MRIVVYPLLLTLAVQCMIAFAMVAIPVLLPALAKEVGVTGGFAGAVTASIYAGAALTAYVGSPHVSAFGAVRSCQAALVVVAIGLTMSVAGNATAMILGAWVIGVGFGPVTAASTLLLTRSTPTASYGFVFSISRISVPVGASLAAVILPRLSQLLAWKGTLLATAGSALVLALLLQRTRELDRTNAGYRPLERRSWLEPLRVLFIDPKRRLLVKVSLVYLAAQSCLASFTVTFLVDAMALPHFTAGAIMAAAQLAGVTARLLLGFASDRIRRRVALMGCIGLLIALSTSMAALAEPGWPLSALVVIFLLYGVGALGWNGVMLAELVHTSSREGSGELAGAFSAVSFLGAVLGPMLFSLLLSVVGYAGSFWMLALASTVAATALIHFEIRASAPAPKSPGRSPDNQHDGCERL